MKRVLIILILLPILLGFTNPVGVYIDNQEVKFPDQQPIISDHEVLIPIRIVAEKLGYEIHWNEDDKEVIIIKEEKISLLVGESEARINDKVIDFKTSAKIYNGRTMVPLRFITNVLEKDVYWNEFLKTLCIYDRS